mmetsp:Transcript_115571/g.331757  ORF Transcript_115571/g.331757 Transcript_115571/m.331757 type:complete len:202 (+) Transcript_115571:939-1544(+)
MTELLVVQGHRHLQRHRGRRSLASPIDGEAPNPNDTLIVSASVAGRKPLSRGQPDIEATNIEHRTARNIPSCGAQAARGSANGFAKVATAMADKRHERLLLVWRQHDQRRRRRRVLAHGNHGETPNLGSTPIAWPVAVGLKLGQSICKTVNVRAANIAPKCCVQAAGASADAFVGAVDTAAGNILELLFRLLALANHCEAA